MSASSAYAPPPLDDDLLNQILQQPFRSSGPSVGAGFTGGTTLNSPGPPMQLPGAQPAAPIGATVPSTAGMGLGVGGPLMTGAGLVANAPQTPEQMNASANRFAGFSDNIPGIHWLIQHGYLRPSTNPWATSPSGPGRSPSGPAAITATLPQFQTQAGGAPPPPNPPTDSPNQGPKTPLGPFVRGPLPPPGVPQAARAPAVQRAPSNINLGYGAQGVTPQAPSPMFTTIDRPNADIAGGRSVAGQLAPQYFTPAREPGGPAQMGALDLSHLFGGGQAPPAGPLATPTGGGGGYNVAGMFRNVPNDAFNGAVGGGGRVARAPVMQASPYVYPRTNAPLPSQTQVPLRKSYNPFQLFGTPT